MVLEQPNKSIGIQEVPVVRSLPKVFIDDLSGLPPNRKIEVIIESKPATIPIHRAPYHMVSSELKELKAQIE